MKKAVQVRCDFDMMRIFSFHLGASGRVCTLSSITIRYCTNRHFYTLMLAVERPGRTDKLHVSLVHLTFSVVLASMNESFVMKCFRWQNRRSREEAKPLPQNGPLRKARPIRSDVQIFLVLRVRSRVGDSLVLWTAFHSLSGVKHGSFFFFFKPSTRVGAGLRGKMARFFFQPKMRI